MFRRRHNPGDDTSRPRRDVPESVSLPSRETMGSSAPESSSSTRGAPYPSRVRHDSVPSRSLSESHLPRDVQQRVDTERDGAERSKGSATSLTRDQGSMHGALQPQSRSFKEEDQHRYVDDRRDTPRAPHHPPLKENSDVHRPPSAHTKDVQRIAAPSASFQHRFETQSRELSDLQLEHRVARKEIKEISDAFAVLQQQFDERSRKLSAVRQERQEVREQRDEVRNAYATLGQQYEEQTKKLNSVRREREAAREKRHKVEEDYAALRQKYEVRKNEYNALNNNYHSLKATLDQRTSELQGVQRFLTTADTFSGSEVVNTLRKLNEEVQQSTTFMTEWAIENFVFETPRADKASIERTRASETLGMKFMQLLGTKKHKDNPILMEIAFRGYLIYELHHVASQWITGEEERSHKVYVDGIYQRIRGAEGQAVSGNWRALTRAHTLPAGISASELAHTIDTTITSGFSDVLLAAGCTGPKSDIASTLWSKFGEKIHHFVSLAAQVNKMIGVGVISEDLEVLVRWPDEGFDEMTGEDSYDNGDKMQGTEELEIVLCATELGLGRRAGMGEQGKPSELIVIKPKVALVSVIDIIGD